MDQFDLQIHGINVETILRNPSPATLYEEAIRFDSHCHLADSGALIAYSGSKTGRSPNDKRVVKHPRSEADVWWGPVNIPIDLYSFQMSRQQAKEDLNACDRLYCVDAFASWDPGHRIKVRTICGRAYHALFMHNMLICPNADELVRFGEPDYVIYNAGSFPARQLTEAMISSTAVNIDLESREMVILGTEYAGEMKKGVFTVMNYLMPKQGLLSMHCSATEDRQSGQSSVLFGLSGTGKTTLSADPHRNLIGDDEHLWTDSGIVNIEGGCYAKTIGLTAESEPQIFQALRYGSILENVVFDHFHRVDFCNTSITQNTRGSYPLQFIANAKIPAITGHPTHIIFLTCDAFGVIPPVSKLSQKQAMYHFISGYTAKVAGTEISVTRPQATFSPCFGGPFLVWHPGKYAQMLAQKMAQHKTNVWLVNTGWTGGGYGIGSRIKLQFTRAIVDAIHRGTLTDAPTQRDPIFGFEVVTQCPHVPSSILVPKNTWADKSKFDATAYRLARLFYENFQAYQDGVSDDVKAGGPIVRSTTAA